MMIHVLSVILHIALSLRDASGNYAGLSDYEVQKYSGCVLMCIFRNKASNGMDSWGGLIGEWAPTGIGSRPCSALAESQLAAFIEEQLDQMISIFS